MLRRILRTLGAHARFALALGVTGGSAGAGFLPYVGIAQIPMYFAPLLLAPFVRRGLREVWPEAGARARFFIKPRLWS